MGISVVINTYNEAKNLQECLDSVKGFDEIVVCDMESTDETVEIARRNGCKTIIFPKEATLFANRPATPRFKAHQTLGYSCLMRMKNHSPAARLSVCIH